MMDKTWLSAVAIILAQVLPLIGVQVGSEQLTTTVQTIISIVAGVVIWAHGVKAGRFTFGGIKKQ